MPAENSSEKKPKNMSWEGFAEQKIRDAQQAGEFDRMPGMGQPIPGIDEPLDENWWIRKKLRSEGVSVSTPLIEARRLKEEVLGGLERISDAARVRRVLEELNAEIRKAIYAGTPGPSICVLPVDVDAEVEQWLQRRSGST